MYISIAELDSGEYNEKKINSANSPVEHVLGGVQQNRRTHDGSSMR